MYATITPADRSAALALMMLLYGSLANARACGAVKPEDEGPWEPDVAKDQKQSQSLEVHAVVAGPSGLGRNKRRRVPKRRFSSSSESSIDNDTVPIGSGKTRVPKEKFAKVRWQNFRFATRSLMDCAFERRVLATHSVTGKPSPAFPNLPAKRCLDHAIIEDILLEITTRYKTSSSSVRAVMTTKCADEAKIAKNARRRVAAGIALQKRGRRRKNDPEF